ncbi:CBL-interacting protein kinase 18 [Manihot esculenta]|uniref:non-specific serine/threonine protein kinase n=1 Tax=Manihot esculenta TaxID=3983 RepID=A0A251KWH7_MANES|nr:CBL-interacting protein kinase 18 [Manihot esculenta]XP_021620546.1 CBL-interacting protein kinase 18 [Manihot esculenta]OAY44703.1 hypothetical protein MANES_08G173300v8 [Manihot esculenta]OAY44704.1 hypothetical protein MANES_08G173300v8 [Manihot esculenta]
MENKGNVLMHKYEMGRLLGQGTFAKVHYARDIRTGTSVAIKIIDKEKIMKVGLMDQIKREISVMKLVRHPNIIQLYEVIATKTKIYYVLEYVKGGELFNKVAKSKLKEDVARKYFQQLISAVDFCHSRGVYHRDLKPENLLLDEDGNLKVSDFGLSALAECTRQDGLLHTTCGSPAYVAPEVIKRKGYDGPKADIWSCGVILYVLLAGYLPFYDSNLMEMYRRIAKADFKSPDWFAPEACRLLSKILDPNPRTRISIAEIIESPWYWYHRDLESQSPMVETDTKGPAYLDCDAVNESSCAVTESKQELCYLNAFDIISYSAGFDLSGLFEEKEKKKEMRFTAKKTASIIISKLEDTAKRLRLKIKKKDAGLLKFEGSNEGRKGALGIDAQIFEITPYFHLVEMKKSSGDTIEYQALLKQEIRPALKDVIWTWQGEQQQQLLKQEEQQEL